MIVVKTFVSELFKKVEMLHAQIDQFEEKVNCVNEVIDIIKKATLKDVEHINGNDIALISENDFKKIIDVAHFNNSEECLKTFIKYAVTSKLYAKLLLDGKVDEDLSTEVEKAKLWLDEQASHIKEFVIEFKESNETYLNNLKLSDNLYQKYLSYFVNDELVKPLSDIEEFNDVLKKSGLIMNEKWQLLKYIAKRNLEFSSFVTSSDMMEEVKKLLEEESYLLEGIDEEKLDFCISLIDMPEYELKKLNLSSDELIKYQKIPILNNIKVLYNETIELINKNSEKNFKKIEKNKKELNAFKSSYDFFKKIN